MQIEILKSEFWKSALTWTGSVSPKVLKRVIAFTSLSLLTTFLCKLEPALHFQVGPMEAFGAFLGLILVVRINAGYDRWWEARKLWGGIVNQSRNLALSITAYSAENNPYINEILNSISKFPFLVVRVLRENLDKNLAYMESFHIAKLIIKSKNNGHIGGFEFLAIEEQRALLIDHLGACERILKSPIPKVLDIKIRRFILVYLLFVPLSLVERIGWYTPMLVFFISYTLLALDQIGIELQNPFSKSNLSALPLDDISRNISKQIMFLKEENKSELYSKINDLNDIQYPIL